MSNDNVTKLIQPGAFDDPLTEVLRNGARELLAQAVEAEVAAFLSQHCDLKTEAGQQRVVRHGHLPEREVMTGIGPVAVRQPRVRDKGADGDDDGGRPIVLCVTPGNTSDYVPAKASSTPFLELNISLRTRATIPTVCAIG